MSVSLAVDGAVARLTLERPEALNALNREMTAALEEALDRLQHDSDISVVIVSGRGRAFCAGNDIAEMAALGPEEAEALAERQARLMDRFQHLSQVAIAAIHADRGLCRDLQRRLVSEGVPLYWFIDVGVEHPAFPALQMAAMAGEIRGSPESLEAAALPAATRRSLAV